jgi:TRAP-type C4-dicarboxylate transport system permease large subunit
LLETVRRSGLDAYSVLIIVVAIYVLLGCLFDGLSLMIMTLPIVFPLLTQLGFDAVWLGVLITIMIEIGQVTPPVGLNLSVLVAITEDEVGLGRAAIAAMPYWLLLLAGVVLLTLFPQVALVLPELVF